VESHIQRIMELEEFASLQLDKPLPDVRVCNIYQYLVLILSDARM